MRLGNNALFMHPQALLNACSCKEDLYRLWIGVKRL